MNPEPHPFVPFASVPPSSSGIKDVMKITKATGSYYTSLDRIPEYLSDFTKPLRVGLQDYSAYQPCSMFDQRHRMTPAKRDRHSALEHESPQRSVRAKRSLPRSCKSFGTENDLQSKATRCRYKDIKEGLPVPTPQYKCYCRQVQTKYTGLGDLVCSECDGIFHQQCISVVCDPPPMPSDIAYEFFCKQCNTERGRAHSGDYFCALVKDWADITVIALYNLYRQNKEEPITVIQNGVQVADRNRDYFHEEEILKFILARWSTLCFGINMSRTWRNNVRNTLRDHSSLFKSSYPEGLGVKGWWSLSSYGDAMLFSRTRDLLEQEQSETEKQLPKVYTEGLGGNHFPSELSPVTPTTTSTSQQLKPSLSYPPTTIPPPVTSSEATSVPPIPRAPPTQLPPPPVYHKVPALDSFHHNGGISASTIPKEVPATVPAPLTRTASESAAVTLAMLNSAPMIPPISAPAMEREAKSASEAAEDVVDDNDDEGEEEEEEFVVEKIVGRRVGSDGLLQYKIKWLGYNNRYNCWVQADDMNCPDKVADYEASLKSGSTTKESPPPPPPPSRKGKSSSIDFGSPQRSNKKTKTKSTTHKDTTYSTMTMTTFTNTPKLSKSDSLVVKSRTSPMTSTGTHYQTGRVTEPPAAVAPPAPPAPAPEEDFIQEIFGANKINNELVVFVRWQKSGKTSWVPAKVVAQVEPEKLIEFYESKIKFELLKKDTMSSEDNNNNNNSDINNNNNHNHSSNDNIVQP